MSDQKFQAIRESQIGCGLSQDQIELIADSVDWLQYQSGDVVFRQNDPGDSMLLVAQGRIKITVSHSPGDEKFVDYLSAGEHFGEMAILTRQNRAVTMTAVMDSRLLELKRTDFQRLLRQVPGLAANVSRALGYRLRRETTGKRIRSVSRVIGLTNHFRHPRDRRNFSRLVSKLATEFKAQQVPVRIVTDKVDSNLRVDGIEVTEIPLNMNSQAKAEWLRRNLSEGDGHQGHVLVCLTDADYETLGNQLVQCEQILWLSTPQNQRADKNRLNVLSRIEPRLVSRIHWGWLLPDKFPLADIPSAPTEWSQPDFKIVIDGDGNASSRLERMSISRLVRFFRKIRLGLALGGGAARGLAHLGVLKAFEEEGIFFDMIAGTSAGALVAVPYGAGLSPDYCTEAFMNDLTPSWFFRMLPKGKDWYMLYQFRMNKWDSLLRGRIGDVKLEQLLTPISTVAADLITGRQIVRDRGDATHAILESINLPNVAKPIMRDGMALVDGGIINNIPADILPERGAGLVLGVDIATQIAHRFGRNIPGMSVEQMRAPSQLQTVMRANEVQSYQITSLRTKTVDQMIVVDTSSFDFSDFTKARELSDAGYVAAQIAMDDYKRLLDEQLKSQAMSDERFVCEISEDQTFDRR